MDKRFLNEAIKEAQKAKNKNEIPIGAVVVLDGKIIGRGHNLRESKQSAVLHAEIIAIEKACKKLNNWRLSGAEIYITLEPCLMCLGAIFNSRISGVYFGATDSSHNRELTENIVKSNQVNHVLNEYLLVESDECKRLLVNFFSDRRNNKS